MNGMPVASTPPSTADSSHISLHELQNGNGQSHIPSANMQGSNSHFDPSAASNDDFFDQMFSTIPSWPDLPKSPWDLSNPTAATSGYDESTLLASRLRKYQISGGEGGSLDGKQMLLPISAQQQQQLLISSMGGRTSIAASGPDSESGLLSPLPLSLSAAGHGSDSDASFKSLSSTGVDGLYNGFGGGTLHKSANRPQHFNQPQGAPLPQQSFGAAPPLAASNPAGGVGGTPAVPRQRIRARRGQATDPHSIAERLRRERIAERMKALQELVPNANKTDKASMLDEIIDYVKFLQLQVKVLSMSRLGGAAAVAPLVADISSDGGTTAGRGLPAAANESMSATEHQVAKLMEEDMGSAMQYLQGKGLCLMPISLASAISTASCRGSSVGLLASSVNDLTGLVTGLQTVGDVPSSPSLSVLTVQSAIAGGGEADPPHSSGKDTASISKP